MYIRTKTLFPRRFSALITDSASFNCTKEVEGSVGEVYQTKGEKGKFGESVILGNVFLSLFFDS